MYEDDDPLSALLSTARFRSGLHKLFEFGAPWGLTVEPPFGTGGFYVAVLEGQAELRLAGRSAATALDAGDLCVLPRALAHELRDGARSSLVPLEAIVGAYPPPVDGVVRAGGQGARTRFIAGCYRFDGPATAWIQSAAPDLIYVPRSGTGAWLAGALETVADAEAWGTAGARAAFDRLADLVFIQALRRLVRDEGAASAAPRGWLKGLSHPGVARALGAIHRGRALRLDAMAEAAGMSRTAFAERFRRLVGATPVEYATRWRLMHAADVLATGRATIARAAVEAGYASETAFKRAFKRVVGVPPGALQRRYKAEAGRGV